MNRVITGFTAQGALRLRTAALAVAVGVAGCGANQLESEWRGVDVKVDGQGGEWDGATTDFAEEQVAVGLRNDGEYLYVGLFVENPFTQAQMLTGGFTVWLDPTGARAKTFGIRYPLGVPLNVRSAFTRALMDGEDADSLAKAYAALSDKMELLDRADGPGVSVPVNDHGIEVAARAGHNLLIYELKVPLVASTDSPRAIGALPGGKIAVGIETTQMTAPPDRPGGRGPGGPGGGGRRGDRGFPGGPGGGPDQAGRLGLWTAVKLSAARGAGSGVPS